MQAENSVPLSRFTIDYMPDKRGYRKSEVLARDLSGYPTYRDLTRGWACEAHS